MDRNEPAANSAGNLKTESEDTLQNNRVDEVVTTSAVTENPVEAAQMWAVGTLAKGTAHDLRNILTSLRIELTASDKSNLSTIAVRQLDRLYALTHALLALSEEEQSYSCAVDLSEIIDFVFRLGQGQAEIDGVTLQKRVRCTDCFVVGNPRRLEQLFVNLLLNALNAVSAAGGAITVSLRREGRWIRVDMRDTGPGIAPENLPHLFAPFFTTYANRTGLGLYSARRIVEAQGGKITLSSRPGRGACATVWLPAVESEMQNKQEKEW